MNIVSTLNEKLLRQNFDDEHSEALLWEECQADGTCIRADGKRIGRVE